MSTKAEQLHAFMQEMGAPSDKDSWLRAIEVVFADRENLTNTIVPISLPSPAADELSQITIQPTGWDDPNAQWEVYIPPTRPEHFEGYDQENPQDNEQGEPWTYTANVLGPWGTTYWATLAGAMAFLSMVVRQGNIKFNDGRTAE